MDFEILDFNELDARERKAILRQSVADMNRVAMHRKREGLNPRGFELQYYNIIEIEKLHHGDYRMGNAEKTM